MKSELNHHLKVDKDEMDNFAAEFDETGSGKFTFMQFCQVYNSTHTHPLTFDASRTLKSTFWSLSRWLAWITIECKLLLLSDSHLKQAHSEKIMNYLILNWILIKAKFNGKGINCSRSELWGLTG